MRSIFAAVDWKILIDMNWGLLSAALLSLALLLFMWRVDRSSMGVRDTVITATLAAIAALGRVPFAFLPGVQPTTFIVLVTGMVFGARAGFLTGCLGALISNFFLGQGPWTVWQMAAWGLAGVFGAVWKHLRPIPGRIDLAVLGVIWGFIFGWFMDVHYWLTFTYPLTVPGLLAAFLASVWFDTLHAAGNLALALAVGPETVRLLEKYRLRMENEENVRDEQAGEYEGDRARGPGRDEN